MPQDAARFFSQLVKHSDPTSFAGKGNFNAPLRILEWLPQIREATQPLNDREPVWVSHGVLHEGPPMKTPERHPYYELAFKLDGRGIQSSGNEQTTMRAGDAFLAGPGVPHHHRILKYPHRFVTVFFLPQVFLSPGFGIDGLDVIRRFSSRQALSSRILHPPKPLFKRVVTRLNDMVDAFERKPVGHAMRLHAGLIEITLALLDWERAQKKSRALRGHDENANLPAPMRWDVISVAVRFLEERSAESLYASDVAKAAGVTDDELKRLFHDAIGVTWVHYLQGKLRVRVRRDGQVLLTAGSHNVTEAAFAAGFESLSHFNATFRRFTGLGPKAYS